FCCINTKKKKESPTAQKQECDCPSLQPSLRNHTHAFFAPASLLKIHLNEKSFQTLFCQPQLEKILKQNLDI
ncbi:MAG: hypothetical protein ACO388_10645, partial [Saprospiraceae bacterium]